MSYTGKLEEKIIAQNLREKGHSYTEIQKQVKVSKDTLSRWCKNIQLTKSQQQRLVEKRQYGQKKGSIIAAENKRLSRIERTKQIFNKAKKEIGKLNKRDKFIAGLALYSAEGDKTDGQIGFSNSDPLLIKFMMQWFRTYCNVPESKFRGAIWIHENLNEKKAKFYWSSLTKIPFNQFHKTYIAKNKINSKKIRKNKHEYGIFAINISNSELHRKIIGWIFSLFNAKISPAH